MRWNYSHRFRSSWKRKNGIRIAWTKPTISILHIQMSNKLQKSYKYSRRLFGPGEIDARRIFVVMYFSSFSEKGVDFDVSPPNISHTIYSWRWKRSAIDESEIRDLSEVRSYVDVMTFSRSGSNINIVSRSTNNSCIYKNINTNTFSIWENIIETLLRIRYIFRRMVTPLRVHVN